MPGGCREPDIPLCTSRSRSQNREKGSGAGWAGGRRGGGPGAQCLVARRRGLRAPSRASQRGGALDLAGGLARDPADGPSKAVFFSDVTLWLDKQGKDWGDLGIDCEAVTGELTKAPVPQLYMTLMQKAHAILCDASREGLRLHYTSGEVEHVTPQVRADVHAAITASLEQDWPAYIQDLIDRSAIQTQ
ncbi:hypothetical protein [Streptomyces sp. NPDC056165]|uniref:hypothetical protein n=1 Tax=Streptomyces sp. NPDC056165 TaxID=3345733 RepID=UPI0035D6BAD9